MFNISNVITIDNYSLSNNFSKVMCYSLFVLFIVKESLSLETRVITFIYFIFRSYKLYLKL